MADYTDQYVTLNDCRQHYLDWGNPGAPPLLLVHGITRQAHEFDPLAARLAGRFHCIAPDVRGRGESAWADPATYSYGHYAKDVMGLLAHLGLERVHYIGTSMGGQLAMMLAVRRPDIFRSVVLNDIGPEAPASGLGRVQNNVNEGERSWASAEEWIDAQWNANSWTRARPRAEIVERARWALRRTEDGAWRVRYDPRIVKGSLTDPTQRQRAADLLWQGFRNLSCPILLAWGHLSDLLNREIVAAMQAAQPGMALVELPQVGHTPTLNEPEVTEALERFYTAAGA